MDVLNKYASRGTKKQFSNLSGVLSSHQLSWNLTRGVLEDHFPFKRDPLADSLLIGGRVPWLGECGYLESP